MEENTLCIICNYTISKKLPLSIQTPLIAVVNNTNACSTFQTSVILHPS